MEWDWCNLVQPVGQLGVYHMGRLLSLFNATWPFKPLGQGFLVKEPHPQVLGKSNYLFDSKMPVIQFMAPLEPLVTMSPFDVWQLLFLLMECLVGLLDVVRVIL